MGISGLNKILKKKCKIGIKNIDIKTLEGNIIAIDTSIFLYKYTYFGNMLESFIRQIIHLLHNRIIPIYIFDGKPSEEKKELIEKRKLMRENQLNNINNIKEEIKILQEKINTNNNEEENNLLELKLDELILNLDKKNKTYIKIDFEKVKILKNILDLCNISYYQCDDETDVYINDFFKKNLVDYVITEDLDFLTHGCKNILYNYNYITNNILHYNYDNIISELDMSNNEFIDLCILLGCDYTSKIKGIGPKKSYEYIKKFNNIENIINEIKTNEKFFKYKIKDNFDYIKARGKFIINHEVNNNINREIIKIKKQSSYEELCNILKFESVSDKYINQLIKKLKIKKKPKNIMSFFKKKN